MELIKKKEDMSKYDDSCLFCKNLELIITQKCNLSCEHCCRGDCSNKEISEDVLDEVFKRFVYIDNLGLGGGEIALVPHLVKKVTAVLKKYQTNVQHFNFSSNGTIVSDELIKALKELYDYVESCNKEKPSLFSVPEGEKNIPISVCFSFDDYHLNQVINKGITIEELFENIAKYQKAFGQDAILCRSECDMDVFDEGRAKNLTNARKVPLKIAKAKYPFINFNDKALLLGNIIAISCDGEIVPANISFADEKLYSFGNITTSSNGQILSNMKAFETDYKGYEESLKKMWKQYTAPKRIQKKYLPMLNFKQQNFMEKLELAIQKEQ